MQQREKSYAGYAFRFFIVGIFGFERQTNNYVKKPCWNFEEEVIYNSCCGQKVFLFLFLDENEKINQKKARKKKKKNNGCKEKY